MPLCIFHTNMGADRVTDEFHAKLSKLISELTKSPEMSITVELRTSKRMCRAAKPEADWGFFELHAVGAFDNPDVNRDGATKMLSFCEKEIGLPQTSCFFMMHHNNPYHIGLGNKRLVSDIPHYKATKPLKLYENLRK
ncbi:MIF-like protein mif-2 [Diadema setosum]|uniref:MIF-like protein mif-2 n=1 Tax=Diadema setosum TaxID=31175 RepID=UPI003B3BA216